MQLAEIKDIVSHTKPFFDVIKMYNDDGKTKVCAMNAERTIIFNGILKQYHKILDDGCVGINRMDVLRGMLNYNGFNESGSKFETIVETKDGKQYLSELKFTSPNNTVSSYRFMGTKTVENLVKVPPFKGANFEVTFMPTLKMISDLSHFAGILGGSDSSFTAVTNKGKLEFNIGSTGNDRATITICDTSGVLKNSRTWGLSNFISTLKLNDGGICSVSISGQGLVSIDMESDFCFYQYQMPAIKK